MKPVALPARPPTSVVRLTTATIMFKRQLASLPFDLPHLSDKAAAQLIDVLHQIVQSIEYHYADQVHRYRKRQQPITYPRHAPASNPTDPPF